MDLLGMDLIGWPTPDVSDCKHPPSARPSVNGRTRVASVTYPSTPDPRGSRIMSVSPLPTMAVRPTTHADVHTARDGRPATRPADADPSVSLDGPADAIVRSCVTVTLDGHPIGIHDTTDGYGVTDGHVWASAAHDPITVGMAVHVWAAACGGVASGTRNPDPARYAAHVAGGGVAYVV